MHTSTVSSPTSLPWIQYLDIDQAVYKLVRELKNRKELNNASSLSQKDISYLKREFKCAEQSRSHGCKFMRALNKEAGVEDPDGAFILGDMKEWTRAAKKLKATDRNLHDLGRGRIYLDDISHYKKIMKVLKSKHSSGVISALNLPNYHIIEGSLDNYLENPRQSGFAGSLNFDLLIDNGKGRYGKFEVQVMPKEYKETDKISHHLFDMIRVLQDKPKDSITGNDKKILKSLILVNKMLFIEQAQRTGFIDIRKDKSRLPIIGQTELQLANKVLDNIEMAIQGLSGRNFKWRRQTIGAIEDARTCLENMFSAQTSPNVQRELSSVG